MSDNARILFEQPDYPSRRRYPVRYNLFSAGWIGMIGAIIIHSAGIIAMVMDRAHDCPPKEFIGCDIHEIARTFAAPRVNSFSYLILVGRFIFSISAAMTLFTYSGDQKWRWLLLIIGFALLNVSVFTFNSTSFDAIVLKYAYVTWILGGGALCICISALLWIDLGPNREILIGKSVTCLGLTLGFLAFPIGYITIKQYGVIRTIFIFMGLSFATSTTGTGIIARRLYLDSKSQPHRGPGAILPSDAAVESESDQLIEK